MIGVFDSGVGGLTVLRAIVDRLPHESTVYLGDTARVPYGNKSPEVVTRYALRIAEQLLRFDIKVLVVACNTASAVALPALRASLNIPVLGVIAPGAQAALECSTTGRIGVLATRGTVHSRAYEHALHKLNPQLRVHAQACPLFVPLAEEGLTSGPIVDQVAEIYLKDMKEQIDTAVLACTHYPLLANSIAAVLGADVRIVDAAQATAKALDRLLQEHNLSSKADDKARQNIQRRFFFTDSSDNTASLVQRFFAAEVDRIELIDL